MNRIFVSDFRHEFAMTLLTISAKSWKSGSFLPAQATKSSQSIQEDRPAGPIERLSSF